MGTSRLERRVTRLEGRVRPRQAEIARLHEAWLARLLCFLETAFERGPREAWIEVIARCCGLPDGRAWNEVLEGGSLSPEAFVTVAKRYYGERWREEMKATMEPMLERCVARHGFDGLRELEALLPSREICCALCEK